MRLINTSTFDLHDFSLIPDKPPYAILSHTWDEDEVTFQDMATPARSLKKGWAKIAVTCQTAARQGLEFAWVDTCCIDKTSSAELTESINSMFEWYRRSVVCYVFLADLGPDADFDASLGSCRWFTRGWTLQELLAPSNLRFYDSLWNWRGSKDQDMAIKLSQVTAIPVEALLNKSELSALSIAERMSWAAQRQTTRPEDIAYCLLGIFGVYMPLIYGEGHKAFLRLQEEIIKRTNDMTIFAWDLWHENASPSGMSEEFYRVPTPLSILAESPALFSRSGDIIPDTSIRAEFSMTNRGLQFNTAMILREYPMRLPYNTESTTQMYIMYVGLKEPSTYLYIVLRKYWPMTFVKDNRFRTLESQIRLPVSFPDGEDKFVILVHLPIGDNLTRVLGRRVGTIHIPPAVEDRYVLDDVAPRSHWDFTDRIFLSSQEEDHYVMAISLIPKLKQLSNKRSRLVALCQAPRWDRSPVRALFLWDNNLALSSKLFSRRKVYLWPSLVAKHPEISSMMDFVHVRDGGKIWRLSISSIYGPVSFSPSWTYNLTLAISE